MSKFYNKPSLMQLAPALVQVTSRMMADRAVPPPPRETFDAYTKKGGESAGVIQMMDTIILDVDKQIAEAETEERLAQKDYEKLVADSAEKRDTDTKALESKEAAKAEAEELLLKTGKEDKVTLQELMANGKYLKDLHLECDWLLQNFDTRKKAREEEIDAMKKAESVLSGADFSLVQVGHTTRLRHGRLSE